MFKSTKVKISGKELMGAEVIGYVGSFMGFYDIQIKLTNGKRITLKIEHGCIITKDEKFV